MQAEEVIDNFRQSLSAKLVFGEPLRENGTTVLPVARIRGGGGGGAGENPQGKGTGSGTGFGMSAKPAGAFVFRDGQVFWSPALDVNRIILGGQILLGVGLLTAGWIVASRSRRRRLLP